MRPDLRSWEPYTFPTLGGFHLPPVAQALMAMGGAAVRAVVAAWLEADACLAMQVIGCEVLGNIGAEAYASLGEAAEAETRAAITKGLIAGTKHTEWFVRRSSLEAMGRLQARGAAVLSAVASRASEDPDFLVRRAAAITAAAILPTQPATCGAIGPVVDSLARMVETEPDPFTRSYAAFALHRIVEAKSEAQDGGARQALLAHWRAAVLTAAL
jgi:hypothetical protein